MYLRPSHAHTDFAEMTDYKGEAQITSDMAQNPFHFLNQRYGILYPVIISQHYL